MSQRPAPSPDEPWPPDVLEDWLSARSDDERRRILLEFGFDTAHQPDAARLFSRRKKPQQTKLHRRQRNVQRRQLCLRVITTVVDLLAKLLAIIKTLLS